MATTNSPVSQNSYKQGHSDHTVSTQQLRTAESDAAFLIPHIQKTSHILDIGCGPGTITAGLAKYADEGKTIGIDISPGVLQKAIDFASKAQLPTEGPGSLVFEEGNVLERLSYPDNIFDIVYCSQLFGHFPPPELPLKALAEIRRVLKPGGILATRDAAAQHFFPHKFDLDRLWVGNFSRVVNKGVVGGDSTGSMMPALFRQAGFDADGGCVRIGAGSTVYAGTETRKWLAQRTMGQFKRGDPMYQSWLDAGISEGEIEEMLLAVRGWAGTGDAWYVAVQCEMLAWK